VTIKNTGSTPITGPIYLGLSIKTAGVSLCNATRTSSSTKVPSIMDILLNLIPVLTILGLSQVTSSSTKVPYILVPGGSTLAAGGSVSVVLDLFDPTLAAIVYDTSKTTVWAGGTPP